MTVAAMSLMMPARNTKKHQFSRDIERNLVICLDHMPGLVYRIQIINGSIGTFSVKMTMASCQ
jgi:hypothetical protein